MILLKSIKELAKSSIEFFKKVLKNLLTKNNKIC